MSIAVRRSALNDVPATPELKKLKTFLTKEYPKTRFQRTSYLLDCLPRTVAFVLLDQGAFQQGENIKLMLGAPSECHDNVAALIRKNPKWKWVFGLALSKDQCWRVHSWALTTKNRIVETTEKRTVYFGVIRKRDK